MGGVDEPAYDKKKPHVIYRYEFGMKSGFFLWLPYYQGKEVALKKMPGTMNDDEALLLKMVDSNC